MEIMKDNDPAAIALELKTALEHLEKGKARYYTVEEADSIFEDTIRRNEGKAL